MYTLANNHSTAINDYIGKKLFLRQFLDIRSTMDSSVFDGGKSKNKLFFSRTSEIFETKTKDAFCQLFEPQFHYNFGGYIFLYLNFFYRAGNRDT